MHRCNAPAQDVDEPLLHAQPFNLRPQLRHDVVDANAWPRLQLYLSVMKNAGRLGLRLHGRCTNSAGCRAACAPDGGGAPSGGGGCAAVTDLHCSYALK